MTRHSDNTPISKEVFDRSGWQTALEKVGGDGYVAIYEALSNATQNANEVGKLSEGRVLSILAQTCSMILKPESIYAPFVPFMVLDDRRSTVPEDFSDEEIELFSLIYEEIDNIKLRARISDLVWLLKKPRIPQAAITAIDAYRQEPINIDNWAGEGRNCWDRAIKLCFLLNTCARDRLIQIEEDLQVALFATTISDKRLPFWIAALLEKNGLGKNKTDQICIHLEFLATAYNEAGEIQYARELYESAKKWYERARQNEKAAKMTALSAEMWEKEAVTRQSSNSSSSYMVAADFYEKAIQIYRTIPRAYRETHNVDFRIDELRKKLSDAGKIAVESIKMISTGAFDLSDYIRQAKSMVIGKSLLDALHIFSNIYTGAKFKKIRDHSQELLIQYPLQSLFKSTYLSSDGRVIAQSPSAYFDGKNEEVLWAKIVQSYTMDIEIIVPGLILPALQIIRLEHRLCEEDFISLAQYSPIVPIGREHLIGKALFAGFDDDFAAALHLLVPQLEHLVRCQLKQVGATTTNIDKYGIENENGLSTLMDNDQVHKIFGEDIAFEIRALFCDPFGPNLRNEIAHGLVDFNKARSYYAIYAWWLLLKMVFNTRWCAYRQTSNQGT